MKKQLLISFSGGETSGYMLNWLLNNKQDEYEMIVVFANTGEENEETLIFVEKVANYLGINIIWVEAVVHHNQRKGTTHKIVNFETASRKGEPFEEVIKKYGIPNITTPHCTRELKERPIHSYAKSLGWKKYYKAIGIRIDEFDRVNAKYEKYRLVYPLVSFDMKPMSKPKINQWWDDQEFRLNLKGYCGNCKTCWKKGEKKLWQIAKETPEAFDFTRRMEEKYGMFVPKERIKKLKERGLEPTYPVRFYRENRSTEDIINESKRFFETIVDDSLILPLYDLFTELEQDEHCEVFTMCK